ncbi:unnamed protein product [Ambrosiozyma monospora]|uniref:Unnamed protein product n=1 Tax=Ambrosiozyma monospora TaxID=43982 RepID=A0ACB5UBF4_AMBMO|nr:unnamed protein product [Ambrosiozyma monospora]
MYIPLNISANKNHLVAFDKAPSFCSSQVLGLGNLKPSGHVACSEPAVAVSANGLNALKEVEKQRNPTDLFEANNFVPLFATDGILKSIFSICCNLLKLLC